MARLLRTLQRLIRHAGNLGPNDWSIRVFLTFLIWLLLSVPPARAQFQQPFVFAGGGAVFTRTDQTGLLTPVSGSPFGVTGDPSAIDVQGRFLFALGFNSIRMFAVNGTTGSYTEVPNSPFASQNTNEPIFIAVEPAGQYIAVVNQHGQNQGESSVETFKIDPISQALIPVPGSFVELDSTPVGISSEPSNQAFFVYLGPNPFSQDTFIQNGSELQKISIDAQTGLLQGIQPGSATSQRGRCFAMDPQGRYIATGFGSFSGNVQFLGIDGKFPGGSLQLPSGLFPQELFIDSSGTFVYVTTLVGTQGVVHIYSVNLQTGEIVETPASPLPNFTSTASLVSDPTGPFLYSNSTPVHGYSVDPQTGYFTEIPGSPFSPAGDGSLLFSVPSSGQPISGPAVSLSTSSLSFGSVNVGTTSAAQTITLTSSGGQALSLDSISVSGADPTEFLETDTCQAPTVLQPGKFCSISVTFNPMGTGPQQAFLSIIDNASDSPQSVPLSGDGAVPPPPPPQKPAVTLTPRTVVFPTITQGATSSQTVTLQNTGTATLNISSVVLGGNNQNDFSISNGCNTGAYAVNATCAINVTFAPLAAGERTMTVTLTDDAPDSPQTLGIGGNANPAIAVTPAPSGSTSATVTAGTSAQYNLQVAPGAGFVGSVSLSCGGAPGGAVCQVPAALSITGGNPVPLVVIVTTTGSAGMAPLSLAPRLTPFQYLRALPVLSLYLGLLLFLFCKMNQGRMALAWRLAFAGVLTSLFLFTFLSVAGCGGGTTVAQSPGPPGTPPANVTPPGTYTLALTPAAMSATGKPLQLQPAQLTLTVK